MQASGFLYWDDGETIVKSFQNHPYHNWKFTYKGGSSNSLQIDHPTVAGVSFEIAYLNFEYLGTILNLKISKFLDGPSENSGYHHDFQLPRTRFRFIYTEFKQGPN